MGFSRRHIQLQYKVLIALSCLFAVSLAATRPKAEVVKSEFVKDVFCSVCQTLITELDEWITSDTTEEEIVEFVEQACGYIDAIIPESEEVCKQLVEDNLAGIIDAIVEQQLTPTAICSDLLGLC